MISTSYIISLKFDIPNDITMKIISESYHFWIFPFFLGPALLHAPPTKKEPAAKQRPPRSRLRGLHRSHHGGVGWRLEV